MWFALSEDRPLFAFAGLWTPWRGVRGPKSAPIEGEHELFGFLTTEPNAIVTPIHPKAMPVILTDPGEIDLWLSVERYWTAEAIARRRVAHRRQSRATGRPCDCMNSRKDLPPPIRR